VAGHGQKLASQNKRDLRAVYATESAGLVLIAALLLLITLIRYPHLIRWSLH